jgi:hypothetical protein
MGAGGDHQVGRREPVVADRRQFVLRVYRDPFDRIVDREARQLLETKQQLPVV